jgi:hypothetical protein
MKAIPYCPYAPRYKYGFDVPREKWIPIRPKRYVYHLTSGRRVSGESEYHDFKRLNIALKGLYGKDYFREGVWANNQMHSIWNLYPINIDGTFMETKQALSWIHSFDVWRIDTRAFNAQWYIDPNHMLSHFDMKENWVFTENSVPAYALKLYHFQMNEYEFLHVDDCTASFTLKPNTETNRIIENRFRNRLNE